MLPVVDFYLSDFSVPGPPRPVEQALFSSRGRRMDTAATACEQTSTTFGAMAQAYEPGMDQRLLTDAFWVSLDSMRLAASAAKNSGMLTDPAEERINDIVREVEQALALTKQGVTTLAVKDQVGAMPFFHSEAQAKLRAMTEFFTEIARERRKVVYQPREGALAADYDKFRPTPYRMGNS